VNPINDSSLGNFMYYNTLTKQITSSVLNNQKRATIIKGTKKFLNFTFDVSFSENGTGYFIISAPITITLPVEEIQNGACVTLLKYTTGTVRLTTIGSTGPKIIYLSNNSRKIYPDSTSSPTNPNYIDLVSVKSYFLYCYYDPLDLSTSGWYLTESF
jgi:hypothetical protein